MQCPTVRITAPVTDENPHGYIVINEADLTEEHTLFGVEIPEGAKKLSAAELREALTAKGVEIPEGAKKAELQALLDANQESK